MSAHYLEIATNAFVTLFVIVDPIGLAPVFVAVTAGGDARFRRGVAIRAMVIGTVLLTLFAFVGEALLGFIGISMPAFRIAGGMLLFLTALEMVFERRTQRREQQGVPLPESDPSVFPLATPFLAGPGSISTIILLMGRHEGDPGAQAVVYGALIAVLLLCVGSFMIAGRLERLLGRVGVLVVTRLLGILLAALSIQFVLDGLADFGFVDPSG